MKTKICHYTQLERDELYDLIALRVAVFVIEQNCAYQDLDDKDKKAWHMLVKTADDRVAGTLRILPAGISYPEVSIGRVASHPELRNQKLGHLMMKTAMAFISSELNDASVRISAQSHLCPFYAKYGFIKTGKEYLEDGIPHSEMLFEPKR